MRGLFTNKYFLIRQTDSMLCGTSCLQMICHHYGCSYSLESISVLCPPTKEGASLLGLNDAAIALGFHTVSARAEVEELNDLPLPCILHWNQNHFVVLYKVRKGKKFYVADPGKGLIKYNLEEFKSHWISTKSDGEEKGIAMFLEPTPAFYTHSPFILLD